MHLAFAAADYFEQEMTGDGGEAESSDSGHIYFAKDLLAREADISKQDNVRYTHLMVVVVIYDYVHQIFVCT